MSQMGLLLFLLLGTLATVSAPLEPVPSVTIAPTAITLSISTSSTNTPVSSTLVPSASFTPTRPTTRQPTITSMPTTVQPTKTPTITPTPVPVVAAPLGLIYADKQGQWQIAADGKPALIITNTHTCIAKPPDGNSALRVRHGSNCSFARWAYDRFF